MEILSLDLVVRWLHVLASVTWVGGLIYTNFVLSPPATGRGIPPAFIRLMCMQRFKWFALGSLALLVVTGAYNTLRSVSSLDDLFTTQWASVLLVKLLLVAAVIVITSFTSLVLGPRVVANAPKPGLGQAGPSPALVKFESSLVRLSQVNLALAVLILYIGLVLR